MKVFIASKKRRSIARCFRSFFPTSIISGRRRRRRSLVCRRRRRRRGDALIIVDAYLLGRFLERERERERRSGSGECPATRPARRDERPRGRSHRSPSTDAVGTVRGRPLVAQWHGWIQASPAQYLFSLF